MCVVAFQCFETTVISKILSLFGQTKNRYFSWRILLPCWIGGHQGTGLWLLVKSLHWKTIHKKTLILESTWKLSINVCDGYLLDIDGSKAYCQLRIDMCLQGWFQLVGRPVLSVAGKMFTSPTGAMYPAHPHLAYASIFNQLNVVNSVIDTSQLEIEQLYLWITSKTISPTKTLSHWALGLPLNFRVDQAPVFHARWHQSQYTWVGWHEGHHPTRIESRWSKLLGYIYIKWITIMSSIWGGMNNYKSWTPTRYPSYCWAISPDGSSNMCQQMNGFKVASSIFTSRQT